MPWMSLFIVYKLEWCGVMQVLRPIQDSFTYIETVSLEMVAVFRVPRESHQSLASELSNILKLACRSILSGIQTLTNSLTYSIKLESYWHLDYIRF